MRARTLPQTTTACGRPRRVGFEIEYLGAPPGRAAHHVAQRFGGTPQRRGKFEYSVCSPLLGEFVVKLDSTLLKSRLHGKALRVLGTGLYHRIGQEPITTLARKASEWIVPFEIVTPPLPLGALPRLEELRCDLLSDNASGTKGSILFAFGLHINPEAPGLDPGTVRNLVRAYTLLESALRQAVGIDLSRRVAGFVKAFPVSYVMRLADAGYRPDMTTLIGDYVRDNPTRNRSLDMLPLFAAIAPRRVFPNVHRPDLVAPRPALHYRLPDCRINNPSWSIIEEWNRWVAVEALAVGGPRLDGLAQEYLDRRKSQAIWREKAWIQRTLPLIE